jgi:D-alanyl-D-alanine carboxypeptidase
MFFTEECLTVRTAVFLTVVALVCGVAAYPSHAKANPGYAGIVVETNSQTVLYEKNAGALRYPASLTKVMTIYLAFEALESGRWTWDTKLEASEHAAAQSPTKIYVREGERVRVRDLVESLIVHSANDAAVVLAEGLAGSEEDFGDMMTRKARMLGMKDTVYKNASGLPDSEQVTTARDQVKLAIAIQRNFPEYYPLFKKTTSSYKGRTYTSHNRVTRYYPGATGLKTGFIRASGFNLITTATRGNNSLIGVVMGGQTSKGRDNHMITLLDTAFAELKSDRTLAQKGKSKESADNFAPLPNSKPEAYEASLAADQARVREEPRTRSGELAQGSDDGDESISVRKGAKPAPVEATLQQENYAMHAPTSARVSNSESTGWGIQVGTFAGSEDAMQAASKAAQLLGKQYQGLSPRVMEIGEANSRLHRAQIAHFSEEKAREACSRLLSLRSSCFVFRDNQGGQSSL